MGDGGELFDAVVELGALLADLIATGDLRHLAIRKECALELDEAGTVGAQLLIHLEQLLLLHAARARLLLREPAAHPHV